MKLLLSLPLVAQTPPVLGPGLQWFKEQYPTTNPVLLSTQTQSQSGEDWYYDIKSDLTGATPTYIACGYSTFVNTEEIGTCISCPFGGTGDPQEMEFSGYIKGCSKAKIAELDFNGNVLWYQTYGPNAGGSSSFEKVIEISGGYIAVGSVTYNGGIFYNPTETPDYAGDILTCPATGVRLRNIYVVKTDDDGLITKEATFGLFNAIDAVTNFGGKTGESKGYDLIEGENDGLGGKYLYITGYSTNKKSDGAGGYILTKSRMIVLKLNSNLKKVWMHEYLETDDILNGGYAILYQATPTPYLWVAGGKEYGGGDGSSIHLLKINPSDGTPIDLDLITAGYVL